ncbi:MAG: BMP family ABC transporter substrate-binding protein [Tissierellia bacterium]|nr:BMP family ABC transporter substrate-binding protein [Tissierellia bacterium]
MNKMKKLLALMLALVLVLAACGGTTTPTDTGKEEPAKPEEPKTPEEPAKPEEPKTPEEPANTEFGENSLYLITDLGTIDDKSFNQGSYEGLEKLAKEIGVEAKYLRPAGEGDQIYKQAIDQAITAGAKVIVTPGFLFETAVGTAQNEYPEVKFIAVDFQPNEGTADAAVYKVGENTTSVLFKEEQSGFLAGYAAVKDGYTKLGFMGGVAVPAVIRFGHGFIAGANHAATEMNVNVEVKFNYTGSFEPKPEIQTMASSWYGSGTEVIFSCGGGIAASVLSAAQANGGKMIGVDVDQKEMGPEVITSAMKSLPKSVYDAAKSAVDGKFTGGQSLNLGVEADGVQISDDFSRFKTFTQADYDAVYAKLVADENGLASNIPNDISNPDPTSFADKMANVKIEYIEQ